MAQFALYSRIHNHGYTDDTDSTDVQITDLLEHTDNADYGYTDSTDYTDLLRDTDNTDVRITEKRR